MELMNLLMKVSRISNIEILKNFSCISPLYNTINCKLGIIIPTSNAIYEETNRLVEKSTKNGFFILKYVIAPIFVLPKAIVCFSIYFTTDLGNNAFELPVPIW